MPSNVTRAQGTAQCHYRVLIYPDGEGGQGALSTISRPSVAKVSRRIERGGARLQRLRAGGVRFAGLRSATCALLSKPGRLPGITTPVP